METQFVYNALLKSQLIPNHEKPAPSYQSDPISLVGNPRAPNPAGRKETKDDHRVPAGNQPDRIPSKLTKFGRKKAGSRRY